MKITVWLATREYFTWITATEIAALAMLLVAAPAPWIQAMVGLPLLAHVGYKALTSLPMGKVPRRPERGQPRAHYDLRACVVRFLDEVRRLDDFATRAEMAARPDLEREEAIRARQRRLMLAAAEVAKVSGRTTVEA